MNGHLVLLLVRFVLGLGLCLGLVLRQTTPASAALRCYVKENAAGGNTGASWGDAYTSLQSALGNPACTEIWVAKGSYKPTIGVDRTISFHLKNGAAIYGGFAGGETLLSQRNPAINATILSGNIGNLATALDNSLHVVDGTGTDSTARLDGFTITGGQAAWNGSWPSPIGAGLLNNPGSPSLANLTFSDNTSEDNGGGMYNFMSSPSLVNVTFINNSAAPCGGAIQNDDGSTPSLVNVTFINNSASNGGAICNVSSSPSLVNVTFRGNSASSRGGGMYNVNSSPSLTNVTFSGNFGAIQAGGIYNAMSSNPNVRNSILYGNTGGEIINDSSTPSVTFSIVQGGWPGTGNLNANPRLKPLGNYGGFTKTMPLGYGSPAIDHGTNSGCPSADQRGIARPQDGDRNGTATCDMGATESRLFLKPFPSTASQDGWVLESSETSSVGGVVHSADPTLIVGDATTRQQARGILSFNTASLPDTAQLVSVVLKVRQAAISARSPFSVLGSLLVDVRKGPFSNNAALQAADFQATASKLAAMTILNNPVNGWYSGAMPATSLPSINRTGLTQMRLRFSLDDNNDAVTNYIRFYSGNAPVASRPVLIIKYYVP